MCAFLCVPLKCAPRSQVSDALISTDYSIFFFVPTLIFFFSYTLSFFHLGRCSHKPSLPTMSLMSTALVNRHSPTTSLMSTVTPHPMPPHPLFSPSPSLSYPVPDTTLCWTIDNSGDVFGVLLSINGFARDMVFGHVMIDHSNGNLHSARQECNSRLHG